MSASRGRGTGSLRGGAWSLAAGRGIRGPSTGSGPSMMDDSNFPSLPGVVASQPQLASPSPSAGPAAAAASSTGPHEKHCSSSPKAAAAAGSGSGPVAPVDAFVVLDFEATCQKLGKLDRQEIIEFPMVIVDPVSMKIVAEFQRYVRPMHYPKLSDFCTELTGITQEVVDRADDFATVLEEAQRWLKSGNLGISNDPAKPQRSFLFVTCGDWDLRTMLPHQLSHTKPTHAFEATFFSRWVNIKHVFQRLYPRVRSTGMPDLLQHYRLALEGRHHSGIDDCRNIANVLIAMMRQDGHFPDAPTAQAAGSPPFVSWNGPSGPWPTSSLVPVERCPPPSNFDSSIVAGQQFQKKPPPNPSSVILPNPKDFPVEYILAAEPPPKFNNAQELTAMSKRLAWALRHNAIKIGLAMDTRGFVAMDDLCAHREFRNKGNLAGLAAIVQQDGKSRYRIEHREGRFYIGATQGHSIEGIDPDLERIDNAADVPVAVHGTTMPAWEKICTEGLKIMGRQYVHFAIGLPGSDGVISGMRNSSTVLVFLDVGRCLADGIPLFRSQNGVILCPGVGSTGVIPPQYFKEVLNARTSASLK